MRSQLKCCRFEGSRRSAIVLVLSRAGVGRLLLRDPSKPTSPVDRVEYQRGTDALIDRPDDRRDRIDDPDAIDRPRVPFVEVAAVEAVTLTSCAANAVLDGHSDVDGRRVDVGELVKRQGCFVRDRTTLVRPQHRPQQIVVTINRETR